MESTEQLTLSDAERVAGWGGVHAASARRAGGVRRGASATTRRLVPRTSVALGPRSCLHASTFYLATQLARGAPKRRHRRRVRRRPAACAPDPGLNTACTTILASRTMLPAPAFVHNLATHHSLEENICDIPVHIFISVML
ncbi:uncharacterized protein LOC123657132 [Melitaea cinxia]|uniref:uncharacterized protein LOC123657132 n=1 Tax=Melitaea cinxia TaxID=113334 RepID=UPI001E272287|nr:uncharacterized protein LOC123657132 [Melitaea cinxia]